MRGGAFLLRTIDDPFPLTGRARIVSEMIELMRTLDAIEQFTPRFRNGQEPPQVVTHSPSAWGHWRRQAVQLFQRLLAELGPQLPGTAGRLEIHRLVASLGGTLLDANGRPFGFKWNALKLGGVVSQHTL